MEAPEAKVICIAEELSQLHTEPDAPDENDSKLEHGHTGAVYPPKSVAILKRTTMLPPLSEKSALVMKGAGINEGVSVGRNFELGLDDGLEEGCVDGWPVG